MITINNSTHHHHYNGKSLGKKLKLIFSLLNTIKMTNEELATELAGVKTELEKVKEEITTKDAEQEAMIAAQKEKIAALEQAVVDAGIVNPAVLAALEDVKATLQSVDDINPDAVINPAPEV